MKPAFVVLNANIVDARFPTPHQSLLIKFPQFVAIGAMPLPGVVVVLVLKANGDPVVGEAPQRFREPVVVFPLPFGGEELPDLIPSP